MDNSGDRQQNQILYLSESDVRRTVTMADAIRLAERGIAAEAEGHVVGGKFYMQVGEAGFIKPFAGYLSGERYAFVKTFSFFPGGPGDHGKSGTSSAALIFDTHNGLPVCLMDADWITGLKTGASTTVTALKLAKADSRSLAVFGAGLQGRMHLLAFSQRFPLTRAWVFDIRSDVALALARDMSEELGYPIEAVGLSDRESIVRQADLIVTVTTGNQALFPFSWLKPGAFVARLGSYQEIDLDVILKADKVVVDRWRYVESRIPELMTLADMGRFGQKDLSAEWPEIVAGARRGRESAEEIIVYIALGILGEYAAILPYVYEQARAMALGKWLD